MGKLQRLCEQPKTISNSFIGHLPDGSSSISPELPCLAPQSRAYSPYSETRLHYVRLGVMGKGFVGRVPCSLFGTPCRPAKLKQERCLAVWGSRLGIGSGYNRVALRHFSPRRPPITFLIAAAVCLLCPPVWG